MRLSELRTVDVGVVYKGGMRAAELRRLRVGVEFAYDDGWSGAAVATSLPIGPPVRTSAAGALPPFFAGMLPEGRRMSAVRRAAKTSADDELTLLLAVGSETIGDVQVVPEGELPGALVVDPAPAPFSELRFAELFARVLAPDPADRVALPGVQDKVSGQMISLPAVRGDQPVILKFDPPEFPHLVHNEAFFYEAARLSGVPAAEATVVHDATGAPGLLVTRFDRERLAGGWRMLAQEDACQVLGRYPADKYRLTSAEVVGGLAAVSGAPLVTARNLLRQLAFAYLTGNGDAHAKNFSVLQATDGEWHASPAYDLPTSHPYGDTTMALSVAGKTREDIGRTEFVSLGATVGLRERAVARLLDDLLARMPLWFDRLGELPFDGQRIHNLRRATRYRRDRLGGARAAG